MKSLYSQAQSLSSRGAKFRLSKRVHRIKSLKWVFVSIFVLFLLYYFGAFAHLFELDLQHFEYPLEVDVRAIVQNIRRGQVVVNEERINQHHYFLLNDASHVCEVNSPYLMILVKSAIPNSEQRSAIRKSWGRIARYDEKYLVKVGFLLGTDPSNPSIQQTIDDESKKEKDIIQENFIDAYYNNTLKTVMALKWITQFCPKANFLLIIDDDYFLSPLNLIRHLNSNVELKNKQHLYSGYVFSHSSPKRHHSSKWYIPLSEYRYSHWPPYVTAGCMLFSNETAIDFYFASQYVAHFRFDDIFIAIVSRKLKVEPVHIHEVYFSPFTVMQQRYKTAIAVHGITTPSELVELYEQYGNG